jgi:hypothetical protein
MHRWVVALALCLAVLSVHVHADNGAPAKPATVTFIGYQQLNDKYVFSLHFKDLLPEDQPPLVETGDKFRFAPYQVGEFHPVFRDTIDPATGQTIKVDDSTLEIIDLVTGAKTLLHFRRQTQLN